MCFSAEASFAAAALLAVAGGALIKKIKGEKTKIFLAMIPCFFAVQQFSEGVLWEAFNHGAYGSWWSYVAQYAFMFFAYLFWPVWIPFAYLLAEKVDWRKYVMAAALLVGMVFYCYVVFEFFREPKMEARVVHHSIVYVNDEPVAKAVYLAVVLTPIFISSLPRMWMFGLLTAAAFLIADFIYNYAYASVWCFASAIIFGGLYFVLQPEKTQKKE